MRTRINSRIFLFQLAVLVVVLSLSFVFDSSADTAVGLSMAVTGMMNIGDIEDVSDPWIEHCISDLSDQY